MLLDATERHACERAKAGASVEGAIARDPLRVLRALPERFERGITDAAHDPAAFDDWDDVLAEAFGPGGVVTRDTSTLCAWTDPRMLAKAAETYSDGSFRRHRKLKAFVHANRRSLHRTSLPRPRRQRRDERDGDERDGKRRQTHDAAEVRGLARLRRLRARLEDLCRRCGVSLYPLAALASGGRGFDAPCATSRGRQPRSSPTRSGASRAPPATWGC